MTHAKKAPKRSSATPDPVANLERAINAVIAADVSPAVRKRLARTLARGY